MLKQELRQRICDIKRQFTPQQLVQLSFPVLERLKPLLRDANVIMAYYSLPDEVYTHDLLNELVGAGKTVLLPQVVDSETMVLRRYSSKADLREGVLHIMEPVGEVFTDYQLIDIVLVPGVAFDAQGHRLGRGRGYYDRFFTLHSIPDRWSPTRSLSLFTKIGVCFDFQKVPEVPTDANDVPVDMVV